MSSPYDASAAALSEARARGDKPDVGYAVDMVAAALTDDRFVSVEMLREALSPVIALALRPPVNSARGRYISSWLSAIASAWAAYPGEVRPAGTKPLPPAPTTAAEGAAAASALRAAIEAGDVIELPSGQRIRKERL